MSIDISIDYTNLNPYYAYHVTFVITPSPPPPHPNPPLSLAVCHLPTQYQRLLELCWTS